MQSDHDVAVVIPAYNESSTIREIAQRAREQSATVIVVDDGSSDGTAGRLAELDVVLLINSGNLGKAASLRRGMECALSRGCDGVVTIDGDGQHAPEDIPRLIKAFAQEPDNIIIAARMRNRENSPKARYFANRFADFWISWAAGISIRDTQSGFRLYPARVIQTVNLDCSRERGFVFESEILIDAARAKFGIMAVPIDAVYRPGARPSHFKPVLDIWRIVRMVAWKLFIRGMYLPGLFRIVVNGARVRADL
jgi:glycosyltransferase involved in cell wall biosynthesis